MSIFSEGLFESIPVESREKFIQNIIEKAGEKFFVYNCEKFYYDPPMRNEENRGYELTKAKICKTKDDSVFDVDTSVVFHAELNRKKIIHQMFKYKDEFVYQVDNVWEKANHWYEVNISSPIHEERVKTFCDEQDKFCADQAKNKTYKYPRISEESEPIDSTSIIAFGLKSEFSRVESYIYANMKYIRKLDVFKKLRVLEYEDINDYSDEMKWALDFVLSMLKSPKYRFGPKECCRIAAEKYGLNIDDVIKGNQTRVNIRSACKKVWSKYRT